MVCQAPLCHNGTAAGNNARHALCRKRDVAQQHTGMNGKIINALLCLFY